jgi:DNA-directed RNA polymerase subunit K/omega
MIVVAGLRTKQLVNGSKPRISPDPTRRRNISIALEEVRRGLVQFTVSKKVEVPTLLLKVTSPSKSSGELVA